jgi:hypothetical protein
MLDFERSSYDESIPAGLTKNIQNSSTLVSSSILLQVEGYKKVVPPGRAEIRVIGFNAGDSQY